MRTPPPRPPPRPTARSAVAWARPGAPPPPAAAPTAPTARPAGASPPALPTPPPRGLTPFPRSLSPLCSLCFLCFLCPLRSFLSRRCLLFRGLVLFPPASFPQWLGGQDEAVGGPVGGARRPGPHGHEDGHRRLCRPGFRREGRPRPPCRRLLGQRVQQLRVRLPFAAARRAAAGLPRTDRVAGDTHPGRELSLRQRGGLTQASACLGRRERGCGAPCHRAPLRTKKYINIY